MKELVYFVFGVALALGAVLPLATLWAVIGVLAWVAVGLGAVLVALTGALLVRRRPQLAYVRRGGFVAVGVGF